MFAIINWNCHRKSVSDLWFIPGKYFKLSRFLETRRRRFWSPGWEDLWGRKCQPTPGFLPGESHGQRSLAGYSPWGHRVRHSWAHSQPSSTSLEDNFWKKASLHSFLLYPGALRWMELQSGERPSPGTSHTACPKQAMWGSGAGQACDREESRLEGILRWRETWRTRLDAETQDLTLEQRGQSTMSKC